MVDFRPISNRRERITGRRASDYIKPWYRRPAAVATVVAALLFSIVVFAALLVWINEEYQSAKCDAYSDETGRDTRYTFMVGCMMKIPGGWIPKEEFRQVQRLNP